MTEDLDRYVDQPVRLNGIKIVHGTADQVCGVWEARAFDEKLTDLGIDHVYVEHPRLHAFVAGESLSFLSDHLHPLHEIARLREGVSATIVPGAAVVDEAIPLEITLTLDVPPEADQALRRILLDLSSLGIPSQLPLEHAGGGTYTLRHTLTPLRNGRHHLPLIMETAFEWDLEDARYPLVTADLDVYLGFDEYYVYEDQVGSGWEAKARAGEVDPTASDVVHGGIHAQAVTLQESYGYAKYVSTDPEGFGTVGYTTLEFWVYPRTSFMDKARVGLVTTEGYQAVDVVGDLGITLEPEEWQWVSIPLVDLGGVDTRLKELQLRGGEAGTFYVDDVGLLVAAYGLEEAIATPQRVRSDGEMSSLLTVQTTPLVLEPGAPPTVTVDLTPIGGASDALMLDDGTGGDQIAGDGIYTDRITVPREIPNGQKDLAITSTDRHLRVVRTHVPLAVVPAEAMYVYRDEIFPGWGVVSTRYILSDPSSTSFVYEGEHALEISLEKTGGFMYYLRDDPEGFHAFGYEYLAFRILVTQPEQDPEVLLTPVTGDVSPWSESLGDQLSEVDVWQEIRIPLGWLAEADFRLKRISFKPSQGGATFYLDDIRFVPEEIQLPPKPETAIQERSEASALPSGYSLAQNVPNPFNPVTTIGYDLPQASEVSLTIYTIAGQKAAVLADGYQEAGHHSVLFDGSGFANGVYLYRLEAGSFVETRRMVLLR
jgi:hypothetical protein